LVEPEPKRLKKPGLPTSRTALSFLADLLTILAFGSLGIDMNAFSGMLPMASNQSMNTENGLLKMSAVKYLKSSDTGRAKL